MGRGSFREALGDRGLLWAMAAAGDAAAILGTMFVVALYFGGAGSVSDSFLGNVIAISGIAASVIVVVFPVGLRTLDPEDPAREFLESFRKHPRRDGPMARRKLVAKALFISVVPSPLNFLGDSVLAFVASVALSLYSNLHGDAFLPALFGFALLVFSLLLLVEAGIAILVVRKADRKTEDA